MRPRWVVVLLILSLAGNAVELGLYARAKWKQQRQMDRFYKWVQTNAAQWNPRVVVQSFEPKMKMLEQRQDRWAVELQWQDYQQPPDTAIDRIALDSVASITRQEFQVIYESRRALPQVEDARLRKRLERRWRQQMGLGD